MIEHDCGSWLFDVVTLSPTEVGALSAHFTQLWGMPARRANVYTILDLKRWRCYVLKILAAQSDGNLYNGITATKFDFACQMIR